MNSFLFAAADTLAQSNGDALIGTEPMTESTFPLMEKGFEFLQIYGIPILHAIVIYIIGVKVVRYATKYICHLMRKAKTDEKTK